MTPEQQDAHACGQFARSLAAEAFRRKHQAREILADHDQLMELWKDREGFLDGYREGRQCVMAYQ